MHPDLSVLKKWGSKAFYCSFCCVKMIVHKVKLYLAIMKNVGKYMPAPSCSKKFKRFDRKYDKLIQSFQKLYHQAFLVCATVIYCCDVHELLGQRLTISFFF